ncbi:hypothetical protein ACJX0J_024570, partial [Zea mays]
SPRPSPTCCCARTPPQPRSHGRRHALRTRHFRHTPTAPTILLACVVATSRVAKTAIQLRTSRNRRSSFGDQMTQLFEFHEVKDPEHLFGE